MACFQLTVFLHNILYLVYLVIIVPLYQGHWLKTGFSRVLCLGYRGCFAHLEMFLFGEHIFKSHAC
jgi:hypothetical protein